MWWRGAECNQAFPDCSCQPKTSARSRSRAITLNFEEDVVGTADPTAFRSAFLSAAVVDLRVLDTDPPVARTRSTQDALPFPESIARHSTFWMCTLRSRMMGMLTSV